MLMCYHVVNLAENYGQGTGLGLGQLGGRGAESGIKAMVGGVRFE